MDMVERGNAKPGTHAHLCYFELIQTFKLRKIIICYAKQRLFLTDLHCIQKFNNQQSQESLLCFMIKFKIDTTRTFCVCNKSVE